MKSLAVGILGMIIANFVLNGMFGCKDGKWIQLAHDRAQWRGVYTVVNLSIV